jgi:Mn2+/Fe2+ NRAMP family transporter
LGYVVAFFTIIVTILHIVIGKAISLETPSDFAFSTIKVFFVQILFPIMFMNERVKYFKSKWQILEACKVQLVEVTLLPKKILKA